MVFFHDREELCPELSGTSRYTLWATRYDNTTEKCYMTGQKGPCGNNMIFYSVANDSVFGECDCNYDIECRSLIYSSVYDECFFAYEQVSGIKLHNKHSLSRLLAAYSLQWKWKDEEAKRKTIIPVLRLNKCLAHITHYEDHLSRSL